MDQQQSELVARAREAARSLQRTARVVEYVAVAALVLLVIFLLTNVYGWPAFEARVAERPRLHRRVLKIVAEVERRGWVAVSVLSFVPNPFTTFGDMAAGYSGMRFRTFYLAAAGRAGRTGADHRLPRRGVSLDPARLVGSRNYSA